MTDQTAHDDRISLQVFFKDKRQAMFSAAILLVLACLDWGIIPIGMDGNLIVRLAIAGLLIFEICSVALLIRRMKAIQKEMS